MSPKKITSLARKSLRFGVSEGRNSGFVVRTLGSEERRKRAKALHADQRIAMEHFFDESPFPGRLVFDIHQAEEIVDHGRLALGMVALIDHLAFHRVDVGDEMKFAGLLRHVIEPLFDGRAGDLHFALADLESTSGSGIAGADLCAWRSR